MRLSETMSAIILQRWWKKQRLQFVFDCLQSELTPHLQDISNKCHAIQHACQGDGAGLTGGILVDMFLSQVLREIVSSYESFHHGENDMKIAGVSLSQKKINGKSTIALDWSKNPQTTTPRDHFTSDILIVNLKTEQWWKKNKTRNEIIPMGIYLVDKTFCKENIVLTSNNKTNTLIETYQLYRMLQRSQQQKWFLELPSPNQQLQFNLNKCFV
jgi:hypothetical protein